jgi:hypothetical protein
MAHRARNRRMDRRRGVDGEVRRRRSELHAGGVDAGRLRLLDDTEQRVASLRS